jgi:5-methylthioadenosine/S-adenosylhomocysteine deaminase
MSRYIIRADAIVTMDPANTVVRDGAIIVNDTRIEAVGPGAELSRRGPFDRGLGGTGFVLFPGIVDAHHHTPVYTRRSFDAIAFERREPITMYMGPWSEEDIYWINLFMQIQLLKSGTTTALTIFYGLKDQEGLGCEPLVQSLIDSGLRSGFALAARDRWDVVHARNKSEFLDRLPPDLARRVEESPLGYLYDTDEVEAIYRRLAAKYQTDEGRFRVFPNPDWTPAATDELYGRMKRLAKELNTGVIAHLLETQLEMMHSYRTYGKSAAARLNDIGFLGPEVTCTDCIWVTEEDIKILADTGVTAVYSPYHITGFQGIAPARQLMNGGVRVAYSIVLRSMDDGYDTLADLRLAERLQHVPGLMGEPIPAERILRMATANGGRAWALDDSLGMLTAGSRADLVLLNKAHLYDDPFLAPDCDIHKLLVYRGRGRDVHTVIVNGEVVVENGRCLKVNEKEAFERAAAAARRVGDLSSLQQWYDLVAEIEPYLIAHYQEWGTEKAIAPWGRYNSQHVQIPAPV